MTQCLICVQEAEDSAGWLTLNTTVLMEDNVNILLSDMINFSTNIQLKLTGDSSRICTKCENQALNSYKFKQQCIDAEIRQLEHVNNSNEVPNVELEPNIKFGNNDDDNYVVDLAESFITDSANSYDLLDRSIPNNMLVENNDLENSKSLQSSQTKEGIVATTKTTEENQIRNQCSVCLKTFLRKDVLLAHVLSDHPGATGDILYPCPRCPKRFMYRSRLRKHIKTHIADIFECPLCGFTTDVNRTYTKHLNVKHPQLRTNQCQLCEFSTCTEISLDFHMKCCHNKKGRFPCEHCSFKASTLKRLDVHVANIHLTKHKCDVCNETFIRNAGLKRHQRRTGHGLNSKETEEDSDDAEVE